MDYLGAPIYDYTCQFHTKCMWLCLPLTLVAIMSKGIWSLYQLHVSNQQKHELTICSMELYHKCNDLKIFLYVSSHLHKERAEIINHDAELLVPVWTKTALHLGQSFLKEDLENFN